MKIMWDTCDKMKRSQNEVDEMKSVKENYFKSSLENFQNSLSFREIYVKLLEKNSI